jgi:cytochrome b561
MTFKNTSQGYGGLTKFLHWLMVILFTLQYVGGNIMTSMARDTTVAGLTQGDYYNWHKSLGLVALAIAALRLANRYVGRLPAWAPTLTGTEKRFIHRAEQVLYLAMFVMPISGYFYVMAGDYGVLLFGEWKLPNPIGKQDTIAWIAKWIHIGAGWALLAGIIGHVFVVLRHQFVLRDGLIKRMLPSRSK